MNEKHVPFGRLSLFTTFQANQRVQTARFLAACIGKKCDTSIVTYHLNACGVTTLYRTLPPSPLSHPSPYFFTLSSPLSHPPPCFCTLSSLLLPLSPHSLFLSSLSLHSLFTLSSTSSLSSLSLLRSLFTLSSVSLPPPYFSSLWQRGIGGDGHSHIHSILFWETEGVVFISIHTLSVSGKGKG